MNFYQFFFCNYILIPQKRDFNINTLTNDYGIRQITKGEDMVINKCPNCNSNFRYGTEQIGTDSNNIPLYHRFGYCDNCKSKYDIDVLQSKTNKTISRKPTEYSTLSIWALVLSIFGITSFIGLILSLVDLIGYSKNKRHGLSWFALFLSLAILISSFFICNNEGFEIGTITFTT